MRAFTLIVSLGSLMLSTFCSAQTAPNPGSAASFALYTSVGAVTNTGTSHVTGNVGTNNGSITGFGNVNGVMHSGDGATLTAVTDVQHLYTQLDTIPATDTIAPLLGNGDTLNPGIYAISGNSTLGLALYLNASGNQNALFIIKIAGTFSADVLSKVQLLNGAQACNVFWKVEGLVSLASGAQLKGTIVANNAAIDMAANVSLEGRALSTAGAISVQDVLTFTPPGCGSPLLNGPLAPNLASASCYALFTGNGSNINTGITVVEGDAGTNVGLTTGYDTLLVNGEIHPEPDSSTAACAADLINASTYLNALPTDIELLYPTQFGNSLVLTPHTYLLNGATVFNDTLFLDARGNPDAVFVIKINGALSTSTFSTVVLMNGAVAKQVYWQVNGAVDINNFSIFKGTIVCNSGAINLGTGAQITGRALTTDGAFTADQVNITLPVPCNNIALAAEWLYFRGKSQYPNAILEWGTTGLMGDGTFNLERSEDGRRFEHFKSVAATSGNTEHHYTVTDQHPLQKGYYSISLTTADQKVHYYRTIRIASNAPGNPAEIFYPNPWKNDLNITLAEASALNPFKLVLYNMTGLKVFSDNIISPQTRVHLPLPPGIYYYQLATPNGKVLNGKIISQ